MDTDEWPPERQELSIIEALKLINGKGDDQIYIDKDLIYKAAIGELTIYVLTDNWSAEYIYQIDNSKVVTDWEYHFTGPEQPPFPDSKDPEEYKRQTQALENFPGIQEIICGNLTGYGRKGAHEYFYALRMSGYKPIVAETFKRFYEGKLASKIELNLSKIMKLKGDTKEYFFCPDPEVLLQDALERDQLFVMKADLHRVFPNESAAPAVAKPKAGATQETQDDAEITPASPMHTAEVKSQPSERSGIRERKKAEKQAEHQRWRTRAEQVHAEHPDWPQLRISKHIAPEFGVEFKTINNNIKIR